MPTRSLIGKKVGDNVRYIYCHFDGRPKHVGATLIDHYDTDEKVDALLDMGDAEDLGDTIDTSVFYARDKGDTEVDAQTTYDFLFNGMGKKHSAEYVYLWTNGEWKCESVPW
jgi:hypothetical protein